MSNSQSLGSPQRATPSTEVRGDRPVEREVKA